MKQLGFFFLERELGSGGDGGSIWCISGLATSCNTWGLGVMIWFKRFPEWKLLPLVYFISFSRVKLKFPKLKLSTLLVNKELQMPIFNLLPAIPQAT